jgi:hypothetical protein
MALHEITVHVTLVSPFLTGGEAPPLLGLDARMPRSQGQPMISGTLIRGVVRDALAAICTRCGGRIPDVSSDGWRFIGDLFGRSSGLEREADPRSGADDGGGGDPAVGSSNLPQRGAIMFTDFLADDAGRPGRTLTRISIESRLGSAKEGHHQAIELLYPIGAPVTFVGRALLRAADALSPQTVTKALDLALTVVPAIGAHKSAGFGRIKDHKVDLAPLHTATPTPFAEKHDLVAATLTFEAPFLVAADRVAPNVFAGSVVVPGGAIKGAVANALGGNKMSAELSDFLAKAVFRAARPNVTAGIDAKSGALVCHAHSQDNPRPVSIPNSLVVYDNSTPGLRKRIDLHDIITDQNPRIAENRVAPIFEIDWKTIHQRAVYRALVRENIVPIKLIEEILLRDVRTRTAIEPHTGAAKYDPDRGGALFVYDMVVPQVAETREIVTWAFEIYASSGIPPDTWSRLNGLRVLIGKADTPAIITLHQTPAAAPSVDRSVSKSRDNRLTAVIKLETATLLTPIDKLRSNGGSVRTAYDEYFTNLFQPIEVKLDRFFARQRLVGGWQAMRFRRSKDHYDPWVATDPGAVFSISVGKTVEADFKNKLKELLLSGLPEADEVMEPRWNHCPLARVNGFGEISLWRPSKVYGFGDWFIDVEA